MTPDDAMISAWLDGTLDAEGDRRMTELAARDEAFARRVERLRHIDDLVRAAVPADDAVPDALLERLGLAPASADNVVSLDAARASRKAAVAAPVRGGGWMRMAAQLALVAGLGMAVFVVARPGDRVADSAAPYRALGNAPDSAAPAANALVKFAPGVGADEAARIAGAVGVRLVGLPSDAGAWKAAAAPGQRAAALDRLRADPRVVMAEPIDGAAP
ncbi:hypothetical protein AQZ52_13640 [Novosphingobium fuchskuhlense]|uniref:Anti-sigma factor n=1 Tax=Novosphingobium fuchskuhlense TaxID=1117702 RepID=A0A124JU49_9SPHN|nr:hypothetical protein [Novosphingobium fuchskuhlense]KUR70862.1 hypothetical protein AQZ52_13640 [Novosphingobium fuchskuhlense]